MKNIFKRLVSFGIDLFICLFITIIYVIILLFVAENIEREIAYTDTIKIFFYITASLSYLTYLSYYEISKYQATYGKKLWGLITTDFDNTGITLTASITKNIIKSLIITILFFFNPVLFLLSNYYLDSFYIYMSVILVLCLIFQVFKFNEKISKTKTNYLHNSSVKKNISAVAIPAFYILLLMIFLPSIYGSKYNSEVQNLKINASHLQNFIEGNFYNKSLPDNISDFKTIKNNEIENPFNKEKTALENISLYDDYINSQDKTLFKGNVLYKKSDSKYYIYTVNRSGEILSDRHGYFYLTNE